VNLVPRSLSGPCLLKHSVVNEEEEEEEEEEILITETNNVMYTSTYLFLQP
jgi:hypothetical protein